MEIFSNRFQSSSNWWHLNQVTWTIVQLQSKHQKFRLSKKKFILRNANLLFQSESSAIHKCPWASHWNDHHKRSKCLQFLPKDRATGSPGRTLKKMEMAHSSVQSVWRVERAPSCSSPTFEYRLRLFQRKILAEPMRVLLAASVENRLWYGLFQQF